MDVLLRYWAVSSGSSVGRWSIRNEVLVSLRCSAPKCEFHQMLGGALALARATRGLPDFEMHQFKHNEVSVVE